MSAYISKLIHTNDGCSNEIYILMEDIRLSIDAGTEITCSCEKIYVLVFNTSCTAELKEKSTNNKIRIEFKDYDG